MLNERPSIATGWTPRAEFKRDGNYTIAIVRSWTKKCGRCGESDLKYERKPKKGIAIRSPVDTDDVRFAKQLAMYRAVGQDFDYPSTCDDCLLPFTTYRQAKECIRRKHDVRKVE